MRDREYAELVTNVLYNRAQGRVLWGPFEGMKLVPAIAWPSSSMSAMILGCYEQELHSTIEAEITRLSAKAAPTIVNVGSAEGYYAVGMARRLPNAKVAVVDKDDNCIKVSQENADANGVTVVAGAFLEDLFDVADLVIMDCEGAEAAYIDYDKFPGLRKATIIVEIHSWDKQDTDKILTERCEGIHEIEWIYEGPRNPSQFLILKDYSSDLRWQAINENRPCLMHWYVMRPKEVPHD